jgi:hypothetical protein
MNKVNSIILAPLVVVALASVALESHGEPISRIDGVPGGGWLGDLWGFRCPPGGRVQVQVDVLGDIPLENNVFASRLDPAVDIFDGRGNLLAQGDDELLCTPVLGCDAGCPAVSVACGQGARHTLVVRDAGFLPGCFGGGTYQLSIEVFNANRRSLSPGQVRLGGGVPRNVPQFVINEGFSGRSGPVVDDGVVPLSIFSSFTTTEVSGLKGQGKLARPD